MYFTLIKRVKVHHVQVASGTYFLAFLTGFNSPSQVIIPRVCIGLPIRDISNAVHMFEDKVPSPLAGEHGETFQGVRLERISINGCHSNYNTTDPVMNRVGDYVGQNRYVVSVG